MINACFKNTFDWIHKLYTQTENVFGLVNMIQNKLWINGID